GPDQRLDDDRHDRELRVPDLSGLAAGLWSHAGCHQHRQPRAALCRECQRVRRQLRRRQRKPAGALRLSAIEQALVALVTPMSRERSLIFAGGMFLLAWLSSAAAADLRHPVTLADLESLTF